jgi:carboxyl-terminal processing protease
MAAADIGYLAVVSMGGFVDGELDSAADELAALDAAMEAALTLFDERRARAVILDLSLNTGGYDFVGLAIAGRFAAERRIAYTRRAGDDPAARDFAIAVQPATGRRYTGPVHVLTSDLTKSAGECGTLALRALDNVRHVGDRTRGAFSTVLTKPLPNGWVLSLSNEVYTDTAGVVWEGRGIEPQQATAVFDPLDPLSGHLEAVRMLVGSIQKQR